MARPPAKPDDRWPRRSISGRRASRLGRRDATCGRPRARRQVAEASRRELRDRPTPATSRRTRRSPTAPGSSCRKAGLTGAVVARMDDQRRLPRLGPLAREAASVATHIVHKWPDDALKVVAAAPLKPDEWTHVFVTYDGSGKAAGREDLRQRRAPADRRRTPTRSRNTIRTEVPLKRRPAAHGVAARRRWRSRTCGSTTGALAATRSTGSWPSAPRRLARSKPADEAARGRDRASSSTGGWRRRRPEFAGARATSWRRSKHEEAAIKARGTIAHVMHETHRAGDGLRPASAASTTSAATR